MSKEERTICETLVYSYLIAEYDMMPDDAKRKVQSMSDSELDKFLD